MKTIREWAFPVALVLAWMLATVYTISILNEAHNAHRQFQQTFAGSSPQT